MFILTTLIIIALISYLLYEWKHRETNKILESFSTPPGWPLLGHLPYFAFKTNQEIIQALLNMNNSQPPVWRMRVPFKSVIYINDIKIIEAMLSSTKYIDKSPDYNIIAPWVGTGLLTSNGKKWHQRRKIITPAFHFKILEQFVEVMEKHGEVFVEKLSECEGREIDVFPEISLYALDVICGSKRTLKKINLIIFL